MLLTKDALATLQLPAGKEEAFVWDSDIPGLGIRLRATLAASRWVFQYRHGRKQRRITIGALSAIAPAAARKLAADLHARVHLGGDPAGAKSEARARAAETMGALLKSSYLPFKQAELAARSYLEVERHLLKGCKSLHELPVAAIDRRAVAGCKAAVAAASGNVAANRTHASLSAFLGWCMRSGLIDNNPAMNTPRYPEKSRARVLNTRELKLIWDATARDSDYEAVIRLLILTGCRLGEIGSLRWSEIADDRIVLPASRMKGRRQHTLWLSPPAREILARRPVRPGRDFVFGGKPDRPLCGWSTFKAALDQRMRDRGAEIPHWTHHDIRRSVATHMAEELAIQPHVIEAVLAHAGHRQGVSGVYNRASYEVEKARALQLWAEYVLAVVEGRERKVIPLRGAP